MKRLFVIVSGLFLLFNSGLSQTISKKNLVKYITFLASDSLHGRNAGSEDERVAAQYIAKVFEQYKLQYLPGSTSYLDSFSFKLKANPHGADSSAGVIKRCNNVIGYLNNNSTQTIVLGAHYDHLGLGYDHNSLDPNPEGKIHNGADDNASGTAGVLELARVLSEQKHKLKFNVIFCLFSAEELGLVGSKKFVEQTQLDSSKIKYMFNFDMIGRMNDSTKALLVMGYGTSPDWGKIVPSCNKDFHLKYDSAGIGPSDYTSFYLQNIPVLGFFTGQHSDYHKPSDDVDKIKFDEEKEILEFVVRIIHATENYPKIIFTKTISKEATNTNFKVTLGIMPDYIFEGKGLRIDGVTDGKPASKAGLKRGDVIIKFEDMVINDIQDYMKALTKSNKGETKRITILRGAETIVVEVTF
jgi:hypothetical protein